MSNKEKTMMLQYNKEIEEKEKEKVHDEEVALD